MRRSPGRAVAPEGCSGEIRYWVIGEGSDRAFGPGWIVVGGRAGSGLRVSHAPVFEDAFDNHGPIDDCDDAHGGAAARALTCC